MHSQNPDVTGMRDLPPLREPAMPSGPRWCHDQSKAEHLAEVEAHAVLRGIYETNKAAYDAERAKRSAPMNRPATVGDRVAALHFKKTGWVPCEEMAAWLETAPSIPRNEPTDMWPADLNAPTPAAPTESTASASPLNLTIDGEKVIVDGVAQTTTTQLIKEWTLATNPRENGGWIAKGWRNGHCYSERRDTLAEAVNGVVAQLKAATSESEVVAPAKPKPPEGTFAKAVIARQVQAVLGLSNPTEDTLTSALYEALNGYEMSLVLVKMLRAQSKKVRTEGADPVITLAKIDALEAVVDILLRA